MPKKSSHEIHEKELFLKNQAQTRNSKGMGMCQSRGIKKRNELQSIFKSKILPCDP